jgi:hypothetical protein
MRIRRFADTGTLEHARSRADVERSSVAVAPSA